MEEEVVLVDQWDNETGTLQKMAAHREGLLHRAFSVFIFDTEGRLLLQKRADGKYHSAGLWSNTCCSHPRPGELLHSAAVRRLKEEMGLACDIEEKFSFVYKAKLDNDLTEYEYDHVFTGVSDDTPQLDHNEVSEWRYMTPGDLHDDINNHPENYTMWLLVCIRDWSNELFGTINIK